MRYIADIDTHWDMIRPWVARCLKETGREDKFTVQWVMEQLLTDQMQLFIVGDDDGIVITERMEYPTGLCILDGWSVCGDNMDDWIADCVRDLKIFALANGCSGLCLQGRPGWVKILKKYGTDKVIKEALIYVEYES